MKNFILAAGLAFAITGMGGAASAQNQNLQPENPRHGGGMQRDEAMRHDQPQSGPGTSREQGVRDMHNSPMSADHGMRGEQGMRDHHDRNMQDTRWHKYGRGHGMHGRHCMMTWRHHHRVRVCR